jgi:hypothetical protein
MSEKTFPYFALKKTFCYNVRFNLWIIICIKKAKTNFFGQKCLSPWRTSLTCLAENGETPPNSFSLFGVRIWKSFNSL